MTGIALVAVGASNLADITDTASHVELEQDAKLAKAGAAILGMGWLVLAVVALLSALSGIRRIRDQSQHHDGTRLLIAVLVALPFLAVRVFASLAYFVSEDQATNAATGTMGSKIGLYTIQELVVTLLLIGAGLWTRNIGRHVADENHSDGSTPTR
jgi:hypothetical protein